MVAEADIPDRGKSGLDGATCQLGGLQQRHRRRLLLDGRHHVGFRAQAKVDMAIDETGKDGHAPAVNALRASRQTDRLVGPDGDNAFSLDDEGSAFNFSALTVEDANLADGNGHDASLIGMVTMTPPMMSLSL